MISIVPAYGRLDDIRKLFSEYTAMLTGLDESFGIYLDMQNYGDEIRDPCGKYAAPDGRLYLALDDGMAAGCIALRRLDAVRCELKRLYVRPEYRGRHIARLLCRRILEDARAIGYREMYLDTLPELEAAIALYRSLGFRKTDKYNDSPQERTIFLRKEL